MFLFHQTRKSVTIIPMKQRPIVFFIALLAGLGLTLWVASRLRQPAVQTAGRSEGQPAIVYLSPANASEVWLHELDGSTAQQISNTGGRVTGLEALPDGNRLVAVVINDQGGSDLHLLNWDGSDPLLLVECGAELCSQPAASPDGRWLAYKRAAADAPDQPVPWLLELVDGDTYSLEMDPLILAEVFSWSPDSSRLAFYDPAAGGIRVRTMSSGEERVLETNIAQAGSWSPDGQQLTVNVEEAIDGFVSMKVYIHNFETGQSRILLGEADDDASDYSLPAWSPDGNWLAYGTLRLAGSPAKQIWLVRPDGSDARVVTDDLARAHANYRWSPDGTRLAFQRFALGSSGNTPELVVWDMASGETEIIAQDAIEPLWLP